MILLDWFNVLLIGGALQGVFLLFAINSLKDKNGGANKYLSLLILLITLALLGRLSFEDELLQQYPQIYMLPDFVLFLFGPILYLYVNTLLTKDNRIPWQHFILAGVHYIYMLFIGLRSSEAIWELIFSGILVLPMYILMTLGIIQNAFYLGLSYKKLFKYQNEVRDNISYDARISYLHFVLGLILICILTWGSVLLMNSIAGESPNLQAYKVIWISLTFLVYVMGFFAMKQPEIFKIPVTLQKYKGSTLSEDDIRRISVELDRLMQTKKPYLNPKLTKAELANLADTNTSNISRVINEGFGKNFFDFVNAYRIQEFIRLVKGEDHGNYTFLAIAEEVGFNSKTTFNTSFKKLTNYSPREYFKVANHSSEELISFQS